MKCSRILVILGVVLLAVAANDAFAQPGGRGGRGNRGGGFGGGMGGGGMGGGKVGLLQNADVQKALELVDDQVAELKTVNDKIREDTRAMFQELRDLSAEERTAKFKEISEEIDGKLKNILLPDQWKRLEQINFQVEMSRGGGFGGGPALARPSVADALGLTDEQKEELKTKAEEIQKETQEKIAAIREEADEQLLSVLTAEQKAKLEELKGDKFEIPQSLRFGGFGGGGGGGGRNRGGERPARPPVE